MSNNPQWKSFQPPTMDSDSSILEFAKSLTIQNNSSPSTTYRNSPNGPGFNGSNNFQPASNIKNLSNNVFSNTSRSNFSNYNAYSSNNSRFPQIGTFNSDTSEMYSGDAPPVNTYNSSTNNTNFAYNDSSQNNQGTRETGIIEKLLHSYGFIQCCERQARLFFHFSQFSGNIEHLKIGDPVEFEMTYDRRTGKPIASTVTKIAPEVVLSEERVTGTVTTELRTDSSGGDTQGRISYENRGECFFLPYNKDDVEGNVTLRSGDKVSFQIATNQRGNLGASHVRLENPAHPVKYQGVVCSMKDSYGFIERADVVKEIFFHFSANKSEDDLQLGDDVEFTIQTRNGKEVACNITTLTPGSVVFEDVATDMLKGQVLKPVERDSQPRHTSHQNDPLPGRIRYRAADHSEVEIPFGDKDQKRDFTLKHGDWVQFRIATDRRDQLQRATNISLSLESFNVSGEKREQGIIISLNDGYGFIRCVDREPHLYFNFNEVLDVDKQLSLNDDVEFTVVQEQNSSYGNNRQSAIRISHLPAGTVKFEVLVKEQVLGVIYQEAQPSLWSSRSPTKNNSSSAGNEKPPTPGIISYESDGAKQTISYCHKDCDPRNPPFRGDQVEFSISRIKHNKKIVAINVIAKTQAHPVPMKNGVSNPGSVYQGFIAAIKDGFGFIETIAHDGEVYFRFNNFEGDASTLELGQEVEYTVTVKGPPSGVRKTAENVRVLPAGTIDLNISVSEEVLEGLVIRPLRSVDPDQEHYSGLISVEPGVEGEESGTTYEFGITSLSNKRELLQIGDPVQFQVDSDNRAANVTAIRMKRKATVESIKGFYGFLSYEVEKGKKLFFHISEVKDGEKLAPGDTVEFVLLTNNKNKKSCALNVTKLSDAQVLQRPERLISRLRTVSVDDGPKLTVTRQPRGPDNSQGFSASHRVPRMPGVILE